MQTAIVAVVLTACIVYAALKVWQTWHRNFRCHNIGCAGCPFYDRCAKPKKEHYQRRKAS